MSFVSVKMKWLIDTVNKTVDVGHDRIETRKCTVVSGFQFIENKGNKWCNLQSVIRIESLREFKNSDKKPEKAVRYYISNRVDTTENFQKHIRSHWRIENKLHWTLDVAFSEDGSRKRNKNAAQNYSVIQKIALNILKNKKSKKLSIASKRLRVGWDKAYLFKVLKIKV